MKRENEENKQEEEEEGEIPKSQEMPDDFININENTTIEENDQNDDSSQENGPTNPAKRPRRDIEEIRLLIPSKMAGAIIGKGGQNIQKLRSEYQAQVSIADCQGPERILTISSDFDTCCEVIKKILRQSNKGSADEYELRVLIHQSLAGCIIGKSGAKIKELKDKIGCRLKVFPNIAPHSTDRVIQIIGKEDQCIASLKEVMELIKMTPIRGPVHNYDPNHFDSIYAEEYGGYGTGMNDSRNERRGRFIERHGFWSDRRGALSSNNRGNTNNVDRDYVNPWAINETNPLGTNNFGWGNLNIVNNSGNDGNFGNNMDGKSSTQVTIPKDLAGAIIGKGGGRIRRIRTDSNAFIQIDEALPGSTDRIITITGTPKQIEAAQYMLQQSVRSGMK